jgi:uncharacterized damage-inducible protein DinB
MATTDIIKTLIEYHTATTRRVWESIDQISDEQFLADDAYSRGSIRNLLVHLANTDRNWLDGLKNLPERQFKKYEEYPDRASVHSYWDSVAIDVSDYVSNVSEIELNQNPVDIPSPRWAVLLHLVNHGTDHRSTVLQKLTEYGAPTFDQDLVFWLWGKK